MRLDDFVKTEEYEELAARVKQAAIELDTAVKHIVEVCPDVEENDIIISKEGNITLVRY
ncbi:MAG TPA: hypothetical protein VI911_02445 [Patescibacteria group bacterium]|nr:hypothetical protein [Patescibacteria group bacterium]